MRRIAFVLPAIVLSGCILGIDNLSGGEGASDSGSADDAGDDGVAIGNDSSTSSDGAIATDAGAEGGRFCPQAGVLLCSDFDDPDIDASVPGPWDYAYAPGLTQIADTTAQFKSAPRSLIVSTMGSATTAALAKGVAATHVKLSFDVYILLRGGNPSFATFTVGGAGSVAFQPTSNIQSGVLEADTTADGGTVYGDTTGAPILDNQWVHLDCVIDLPTHTATLTINGAQTISRTLANTTNWTTAHSLSVALGIANSGNETIYYDNVTITTM
jgi:hypothetical protein